MTTFHLVRHAERDTPGNILPGCATGIHLTENGRAQAECLARHFHARPLEQIYSSPQERALETAAPLAKTKQLAVQINAGFCEFEFGLWTWKSVADLEPDPRWHHFNRFRSGTRVPGGEAAHQVQARFVGELLKLGDAFPDQRIACISHADPIRLALLYFLGAPVDFFDRIEIAVASISTLELAEWGARLVRLNEVPCE